MNDKETNIDLFRQFFRDLKISPPSIDDLPQAVIDFLKYIPMDWVHVEYGRFEDLQRKMVYLTLFKDSYAFERLVESMQNKIVPYFKDLDKKRCEGRHYRDTPPGLYEINNIIQSSAEEILASYLKGERLDDLKRIKELAERQDLAWITLEIDEDIEKAVMEKIVREWRSKIIDHLPSIKYLGQKTAMKIIESGYDTPSAMLEMSREDLEKFSSRIDYSEFMETVQAVTNNI